MPASTTNSKNKKPIKCGVYALRHKETGMLYFGSTKDFKSRRAKWWGKMNCDRQNLPPAMRALTASRNDWEFIVLQRGEGVSSDELCAAERRAVEIALQRAPDKVLNVQAVYRPDGAGLAVGSRVQSLNAWSRETGIPRATIGFRIKAGWTPEQSVGLSPAPERDYKASAGVMAQAMALAKVVVYDDETPLSTTEAAEILHCDISTLRERLRRYRVVGGQGRVQLKDLQELTARYRRG